MYDLLLIITALLFYALGRASGHEVETLTRARTQIKKQLNKGAGGAINYATPEDLRYSGSEKEKKDQAQSSAWSKVLK